MDPDKVNRSGGAIAMGHPIGMSGARITLHAALELARRGSGYAAAALCGAGGQGERPDPAPLTAIRSLLESAVAHAARIL